MVVTWMGIPNERRHVWCHPGLGRTILEAALSVLAPTLVAALSGGLVWFPDCSTRRVLAPLYTTRTL